MKKIGLVFSGGGGKGAYEIGAWKTLKEYGFDKYLCCIAGTSVGALNATLLYRAILKKQKIYGNLSITQCCA